MSENGELRKQFRKHCKLYLNEIFFNFFFLKNVYLSQTKDGDEMVESTNEKIPIKPQKRVNFISKLLFLYVTDIYLYTLLCH